MTAGKDWLGWHEGYADETSALSRRLRLVQQHIASWLDERDDEALTVVSACAGQGRDLLGVLSARADANRVRATLLEHDPRNVAAAQAAVDEAALPHVTVVRADAGDRAAYVAAVPADLVLMAGVFGNISDIDVRGTISALPELCAADAIVIWTRTRRAPDLTPAVRRWLAAAGFDEQAFHAPVDALFSVGVHRFGGVPRPLTPRGRLFRFLALTTPGEDDEGASDESVRRCRGAPRTAGTGDEPSAAAVESLCRMPHPLRLSLPWRLA